MKIKKFLTIIFFLLASGAFAQQTKADLINYIDINLPSANKIKISVLRGVLAEIVNSYYNTTDDAVVTMQFSADGAAWHDEPTAADIYARGSVDAGVNWTPLIPMYDGLNLNLNDNRIINLAPGVDSTDAVNLAQMYEFTGAVGIDWTLDQGAINIHENNLPAVSGGGTNVYSITLPYSSTVAGRCAAATEGVDYPSGWVVEAGASSVDLKITHSLTRRVASVSVFAVTGSTEQQLFNTAAFNGIKTTSTEILEVQSLATISKAIVIYIIFL